MNTIRIATRKSPLALWQAEHVSQQLNALHPHLEIELLKISTRGDKILDSPLNKVGGKGLFVKELEQAILENKADIAVHSMKDVPMDLPSGLTLPVIMQREDPHDAFVSKSVSTPAELPAGSVVGTSSLRREAQLRKHFPALIIKPLRGNVGSRLQKLSDGEFDAIILAAAGLKRLQLEDKISSIIDSTLSLPAAGQGAIGIECRSDDKAIIGLIMALHDHTTSVCVTAERAVNRGLNGGCQVPIAAYATLENEQIHLRALVADPNGRRLISGEVYGLSEHAEILGRDMAVDFLTRGAREILADVGIVV